MSEFNATTYLHYITYLFLCLSKYGDGEISEEELSSLAEKVLEYDVEDNYDVVQIIKSTFTKFIKSTTKEDSEYTVKCLLELRNSLSNNAKENLARDLVSIANSDGDFSYNEFVLIHHYLEAIDFKPTRINP